jgi:hypothetical protein
MKVWVYVEGVSDRLALLTLWASWLRALSDKGWGIRVLPLDDKSRFLRKIGVLAAEKLVADSHDVVVGLPDLYPAETEGEVEFRHSDLAELASVQQAQVKKALRESFGRLDATSMLERFHAAALKHDLEVLLLAAKDALRSHLRTTRMLDGLWRHPPEEQDQQKPPKRVVEELFRVELKRRYRDTTDAPDVLRGVSKQRDLLYDPRGAIQCPVFKDVIDWIGSKTGVPGY